MDAASLKATSKDKKVKALNFIDSLGYRYPFSRTKVVQASQNSHRFFNENVKVSIVEASRHSPEASSRRLYHLTS